MTRLTRRAFAALTAMTLALPGFAATLGDDGLHKEEWMRDTFKDLREDLEEANAEGKRLLLMFEQRGCIYCKKMHEEIYPISDISDYISEHYFVVQLNLHGATEVTDFDGETLSEREMARKWGIMFTPTLMFFGAAADEVPAPQAAVATMPGAFGPQTTYDLFVWVNEGRYADQSEEDFQRYHARRIAERGAAGERLEK